jgi:hypothetical protein
MSYGEPTLLPDYGRFIDLSNEVRSFTALLLLIHIYSFFFPDQGLVHVYSWVPVFYLRMLLEMLAEDLYCFTGSEQASYYLY